MALSYCSNWESFPMAETDMAFLDPELQAFPYDDHFFDVNHLFLPENLNSLLHDGAPFDNTNAAIATDPFLLHQPSPFPKRQKLSDFEQYSDEFDPAAFSNGFVSPPETAMLPLPEFPITGSCESVKKETGGGSLSAQSIAARQRRRRITEKTQELGKLVPGGPKMNTAEMLQSAYKYIKYLQAQLRLLQLITASHNQETPLATSEELHHLLQSPLIQEKLYSTENCLLPLNCVEQLGIDQTPSLKNQL